MSAPAPPWLDLPYPKIPLLGPGCPGGRCVAFEKLDGTNLSWAWTRGFGWGPAGTRRGGRLTGTHPELGPAVGLFARARGPLDRWLARVRHAGRKLRRARLYCELLGPGSFAGRHRPGDPMQLYPIDLAAEWEGDEAPGLLGPELFLHLLSLAASAGAQLPAPRVVWRGSFRGGLPDAQLPGEGVVWKGGDERLVWAAKQKSQVWLARLRQACQAGSWVGADGQRRTVVEEHGLEEHG